MPCISKNRAELASITSSLVKNSCTCVQVRMSIYEVCIDIEQWFLVDVATARCEWGKTA